MNKLTLIQLQLLHYLEIIHKEVSIVKTILKKDTHLSHIVEFIDLVFKLEIDFHVLHQDKERWNKDYSNIVASHKQFFDKHKLSPIGPSHLFKKQGENIM